MSRMTTIEEDKKLIEFAEKAAKCFREDLNKTTFSSSGIESGCFLALRWGMGNDCVLVVKLDDYFQPVNFQQAI